jgi:hypothetical protein
MSVTGEHWLGLGSSCAQVKNPTSRKGREKWGTRAILGMRREREMCAFRRLGESFATVLLFHDNSGSLFLLNVCGVKPT